MVGSSDKNLTSINSHSISNAPRSLILNIHTSFVDICALSAEILMLKAQFALPPRPNQGLKILVETTSL